MSACNCRHCVRVIPVHVLGSMQVATILYISFKVNIFYMSNESQLTRLCRDDALSGRQGSKTVHSFVHSCCLTMPKV